MTMEMQHIAKDGGLKVHITGSDVKLGPDTGETVTEHEPEHFVVYTRVIPPLANPDEPGDIGTIAGNGFQQILGQDPLRKSAAIYSPDGPFIGCHSEAQASNAANYETGTPFPEGAYFPQGSSFAIDGTGPLWAVNPGSSTIRITIVTNRYGL